MARSERRPRHGSHILPASAPPSRDRQNRRTPPTAMRKGQDARRKSFEARESCSSRLQFPKAVMNADLAFKGSRGILVRSLRAGASPGRQAEHLDHTYHISDCTSFGTPTFCPRLIGGCCGLISKWRQRVGVTDVHSKHEIFVVLPKQQQRWTEATCPASQWSCGGSASSSSRSMSSSDSPK